jgi:peptide/nickel transport system substrate-binding protein
VATLRVRVELARSHIFDHTLAQRTDSVGQERKFQKGERSMGKRFHLAGIARTALATAAAMAILATTGNAQQQGGSITLGLELDIAGFDPVKVGVFDTAASMAAALLFDTLTARADDGDAVPKLAESWTHSDDYKTWSFKLRSGVRFHDGTPFNAQAVAWKYARHKDPKNRCGCAFFIEGIDSVEAVDDLTAVFHLRDPSVELPALLSPTSTNNIIYSPSATEKLGNDYNRHPVGTGPFVLKSWTAGDRVVVERNTDYWNKGHPHLDRVVLRPLPDQQSRFSSLLAGDADLVWDDESDSDNLLRAKNDPSLKVHTYVGSGAQVAAFNTKAAPFEDVRVRQALVMAIDRKVMSQVLTNGLSRPASNPYGDGSWVKCEDDGALPHDPEKARQLIKDYGKPVEFKMLFTATPRGRASGQVLQQFWKQVGANMEIEQVDQTTIPTRAFARKFQITPWRIPDLADPSPIIYALFHTGSPTALANYSNPELDALLERARSTADRAKRTEDYCAISRLINREATWFWTFQNTYYAVAKSKLKGLPKLYSGVIDVSDTWLE